MELLFKFAAHNIIDSSGSNPLIEIYSFEEKLIAKTFFNYMLYVSSETEYVLPGSVNSDVFAWIHIHCPPMISMVDQSIVIDYDLGLVKKNLTFRLERTPPKHDDEIMGMYNTMNEVICRQNDIMLELAKKYDKELENNRMLDESLAKSIEQEKLLMGRLEESIKAERSSIAKGKEKLAREINCIANGQDKSYSKIYKVSEIVRKILMASTNDSVKGCIGRCSHGPLCNNR